MYWFLNTCEGNTRFYARCFNSFGGGIAAKFFGYAKTLCFFKIGVISAITTVVIMISGII